MGKHFKGSEENKGNGSIGCRNLRRVGTPRQAVQICSCVVLRVALDRHAPRWIACSESGENIRRRGRVYGASGKARGCEPMTVKVARRKKRHISAVSAAKQWSFVRSINGILTGETFPSMLIHPRPAASPNTNSHRS